MLKKTGNLTKPKKLLLLATTVCVLIMAVVLIYSNSRYCNRYLEKVKGEIQDIFYKEIYLNQDVNGGCGVYVDYQERVVKVQLSAKNTFNEELIEWLEDKYGKAVSISEGYFW